MPFSLPSALVRLGTKFTGAGDCLSLEESISTLDKTRRAAVTAKEEALSTTPPCLLTDSLLPDDLFLYADRKKTQFIKGNQNINARSLSVVGGAIFESKTCKFPVSVLFSHRTRAVLVHAGNAPLARLETEFYDYAFEETHEWLNTVMDEESSIKEFVQWYREAAIDGRTCGFRNIPNHLLGSEPYTMLRHGVTAFLSIRAPNNEAEFKEVAARLESDLRVYPMQTRDHMELAYDLRDVVMGCHFRTEAEITASKEATIPDLNTRREHAEKLMRHPVITWLSNIILKNAADDGYDEQNEPIAEYDTGIKRRLDHPTVLHDVAADEFAHSVAAKCTKDAQMLSFSNEGFTLPSVMTATGRAYTTKCVCDKNKAVDVMLAVAREIFEPADATQVGHQCSHLISDTTTSNTALVVLGKQLLDSYAILIVSRETDGRISSAKLVSGDVTIPSVNKDAMTRLVGCTWVQIVILDHDRVSLLLTREPEHIRNVISFEREKLKLRSIPKCSTSAPSAQSMDAMRPKIEELVVQVGALKAANEATLASVNDFKRKLDFLVQQKAECADDEPLPKRSLPPTAGSSIFGEIEETYAKLVRFEKRSRCE